MAPGRREKRAELIRMRGVLLYVERAAEGAPKCNYVWIADGPFSAPLLALAVQQQHHANKRESD